MPPLFLLGSEAIYIYEKQIRKLHNSQNKAINRKAPRHSVGHRSTTAVVARTGAHNLLRGKGYRAYENVINAMDVGGHSPLYRCSAILATE